MQKNKVKVLLRLRPSQQFSQHHLDIQDDDKSIHIHQEKDEKHGVVNNQVNNWSFMFDGIFVNTPQEAVFQNTASQLVDSVLAGYNCTIMCYGQTGAGKTFTMTGATESFNNRGLIPRSLSQLYRSIEKNNGISVTVQISYMEIYNEQIFDLLGGLAELENAGNGNANGIGPQQPQQQLIVVEEERGGVAVKGLTYHRADTEEEALNLLFEGETNRATASHVMNKRSSRSHCIFTVFVESRSRLQSNAEYSLAKINFVDLAGSERLRKTQSTGRIMQEATYINRSLSFLEQVVIALSEANREHVPFRQSKLTHYLKDSIGGHSQTILIANIWAEADQLEESISTMRFASRMMRVASQPIKNKVTDPIVFIRNLQKEIEHLKRELTMHNTLSNQSHVSYDPLSEQQRFEIKEQVRRYVEGNISELDIVNIRQIQAVYEAFRNYCRQMNADWEDKLQSSEAALAALHQQSQSPQQQQAGGPVGTAGVSSSTSGAAGKPKSKTGAAAQQQAPSAASPTSNTQHPPSTSGTTAVATADAGAANKVGQIVAASGFGVGSGDKTDLDESGPYLQSRRRERRRNQQQQMAPGGPEKSFDGVAPQMVDGGFEPPSRTEAFEEFKKEEGVKLSAMLDSNKDILEGKKREYETLAGQINRTKLDIDECRRNLDSMKSERELQGQTFTEEGEMIITEEEFTHIQKLRQLKNAYKTDYEALRQLKHVIHYCKNQVDLARQTLVKEFDSWYTDMYLMGSGGAEYEGGREGGATAYEDPIEKFYRVKTEQFHDDIEAEAYNRAQENLEYRRAFEKASRQAQPLDARTRRKALPPGTPVIVSSQQAKMPTSMHIIKG